jgi:hypothetical protein
MPLPYPTRNANRSAEMLIPFLGLLCGAVLAASPNMNEPLLQLLNQKVPTFFPGSDDGFHSLCLNLRIPCGEELLPNESFARSPMHFTPERIRVRAYLDKLVEDHPAYFWEISDGVLMFRPRSPGRSSPLDNRIALFVRKDQWAEVVVGDLANSEWIQLLRYATVGPPSPDDSDTKKISVTCADASVRQILNTIVHAHGHAIWIYIYSPKIRFVPNIFFRGKLISATY